MLPATTQIDFALPRRYRLALLAGGALLGAALVGGWSWWLQLPAVVLGAALASARYVCSVRVRLPRVHDRFADPNLN